jgi:hypothetical protein
MRRSHLTTFVLFSLILAVVFCAPASAQLEQRIITPFRTTRDPTAVAVGDFNGDGIPDVAVVGRDLQIFLGKGDGTFQSPLSYAVGAIPDSIAVSDFNGDGKLDVVLTHFDSGANSVLFGNGDGTFTSFVNLPTSNYGGLIAVGDFNGDGKPDVLIENGSLVTVFLNNGNGTFKPGIDTIVGGKDSQLVGVGVGDFNRDGILDVAVANDEGNGDFSILSGKGDGSFVVTQQYSQNGVGPIAVGDLRGNGLLDLVVGASPTVYLGNGDGTFQPGQTYSTADAMSLTIADFNGDGKPDLIVADFGTYANGDVSVLLGNGDGTFQPTQVFPTSFFTDFAAVGDLNGDGMLDVAVVDRNGNLFTMLNTGTADFSPTSPVTFANQLIGTTSSPMAATMTNAGITPISISSVTSSGPPFKITKNTCTGSLAPAAECKISANFTPTVKDSVTGTLTIIDSASSKPQVVELTGPGTYVKLVPSALNFPPTKVGSTSAPQTMQLTNTGSAPLNFTYFIFAGGGYGNDYPESDNCGTQLAAGASCTITVSFSPHNTGARNAYLDIQDDGGGSPQEPKLTGTGD